MKIKKLIHRIFIISFALFFVFYSCLYGFCVPIYASALPELNPSVDELVRGSFRVIEGGSNNPEGSFDIGPYYNMAMEIALIKFAEPGGGYDHLVATEEQLAEMCSDFVAEYGDDVFRIAVTQPADMTKKLFWNYPNQALGWALDKLDCGIAIAADEYVQLSDSLVSKLNEFLGNHVKHGVYYHDLAEGKNRVTVLRKNVYYDVIDDPTGVLYHYEASSNFGYIYGVLNSDHTIINFHDSGSPNELYTWMFTNTNNSRTYYSWYQNPGKGHFVGSDMLIFSFAPDTTKVKWWYDALNFTDLKDYILQPCQNPFPYTDDGVYKKSEVYPFIENTPDPTFDPSDDPSHDPDGYPIPNPAPIEVPSKVPDPSPSPVPIEVPTNPDPVPDPVDPDPIIIPDPPPDWDPWDPEWGINPPDPDPDPVDPDPVDPDPVDPDPVDPDPDWDIDFPDDSGGNFLFDLSEFFPFCLPMDLYLAMKMLSVDSEDEYYSYFVNIDSENESNTSDYSPVTFEVPVTFHLEGLNAENVDHNFVIDIVNPSQDNSKGAEPYVKYLRFFLLFLYIVFLIFATIKIIPR